MTKKKMRPETGITAIIILVASAFFLLGYEVGFSYAKNTTVREMLQGGAHE